MSILGGDPLWQNEKGLRELISLCEKITGIPNKNIWIWSGFTWEEIFEKTNNNTKEEDRLIILRRELILSTNVFIDGRFEKDKKDLSLKWRGSFNQRVIDVKTSKENSLKPFLYCN